MDRCNANVSGKLDTKIEDKRQFFRNTGDIYWFRAEKNVLLMLFDNHFARNGC